MPVGYKPPKFDMFNGKGDPHAHLRAKYDKCLLRQDDVNDGLEVCRIGQDGRLYRGGNPQITAHTSYVPYTVYNTQPHYNPPRTPAYQNPPRLYVPVQALIHQNRPAYAPRPRPNLEARNARTYTPIAEPYAQLFDRLRTTGVLQPIEGKLPDPTPRNFNGNKRCAYHLEIQGHDTERFLWFEELDRVFDQKRSNQMHSNASQCEQQPFAKP
ncbi:hypothetical protein H5410_030910 [Solanum commersonii]|uniref:Uncharacterized protein n=1 Tax=Solanum commersonii TaxID=4109 RepID=A0A9J5YK43_SOLCO|nr:hypothetical protein H5410_030910 [Solanum commersonii]